MKTWKDWLAFIGAVAVLALMGIMFGIALDNAEAHHGCHTKKCEKRVWNKKQPTRHALASWYSLNGNTLGCGGIMRSGVYGVAHKGLRCGTKVRICYRGCVTAVVNDRGPYVGPREFDLSATVAQAVGFSGVAVIRWRLVR